jgi:hypothetical protein
MAGVGDLGVRAVGKHADILASARAEFTVKAARLVTVN